MAEFIEKPGGNGIPIQIKADEILRMNGFITYSYIGVQKSMTPLDCRIIAENLADFSQYKEIDRARRENQIPR